jgi:hypothetical protein
MFTVIGMRKKEGTGNDDADGNVVELKKVKTTQAEISI